MLKNYTPHPITIRLPDGFELTIPSHGVARVATTPGELASETTGGIPIYSAPSLGEVEGLPPPNYEDLFIVSSLVASKIGRARFDVVSPGTGPNDGAIRDEKGRITAVTRLIAS